MALWTPYTQQEPLDLSKNALKSEEVSARPWFGSPEMPPQMQGAAAGYIAKYPDTQYPYGYYHQPAAPHTSAGISYVAPAVLHTAPAMPYVAPASTTPRISPDSTGNWCLPQPNPPSSSESGFHISDSESLSGDMEYQMFESQAFQGLSERNGGSLVANNPRMRRAVQTSQSNDSYRRQREKNNLAAKQSRDRRKIREMRLAFQVSFLKQKLATLKSKMAASVCARCAGQM